MSGKLNLSRITYLGIVPRDIVTENNSIEKVLKIGHKTSQNIEFYDKILYTAQEPNCETYDFKIVKITPLELIRTLSLPPVSAVIVSAAGNLIFVLVSPL